MEDIDIRLVHAVIDVARNAKEHGNHPFGALLVDSQNNILMCAENTVVTERDCTGHAETNLVRQASKQYSREFLENCTLYASTEPCPMCTGAIFWANIRKIVFGLSQKGLYEIVNPDTAEILNLSCRDVLLHGNKTIDVIGPVLEEEAKTVHHKFWN